VTWATPCISIELMMVS